MDKHDNSPIVYLDGECLLCDRAAMFLYYHSTPGQFRFALLQDHRERLPTLETTVVVQTKERFYIKGEAIIFLMQGMISPYPRMAQILSIFPIPIINIFYQIVACLRYRFGRKQVCSFPKNIERKYFLNGNKQ